MKELIWYIIMIPCCALLYGVGVYAWDRKKPMWFWIGSPIKKMKYLILPPTITQTASCGACIPLFSGRQLRSEH